MNDATYLFAVRVRAGGKFRSGLAAFLKVISPRAAEILDRRFTRDKKKASKGGRELWFINHLRGEKGGNSFSFNIEKGLAHDIADPGFDKDLIGLVCLTDGLGEGKEARLEAVRVVAEELKIETPWFARGRRSGPQQSGEASSGWRFQWQAAKSLLDPTVKQHSDLSAPLEYLDGRALDGPRSTLPLFYPRPRFAALLRHVGDQTFSIGKSSALLAALTEAGEGEPVSLIRVWLERSNDGKVSKVTSATLRAGMQATHQPLFDDDDLPPRKLTPGGCGTAGVWLGIPADVAVVAEGVETALTAVYSGYYAVASCGVARLHVLNMAPGVKTVILAPDRQDVAEAAAVRAAEVYSAHELAVRIARMPRTKREGYDLNDALREDGPDAVKAIFEASELYVPPKAPAEPTATFEEDAPETAVPSGLLDIPGVYGALAHYLKDFDEYSDPIKALAISTVIMAAVAPGYRVKVGNNTTQADLLVVNIAASGRGKTRLVRRAADILYQAVGDRTLLRISNFGTPEGLWDDLEDTQRMFGLPARVLIVDEFGSELREMADGRSYKGRILPVLRSLNERGHRGAAPSGAVHALQRGPARGFTLSNHFHARHLNAGPICRSPERPHSRRWQRSAHDHAGVSEGLELDDTQVPEPKGVADKLLAIFEHTVAAANAGPAGRIPLWVDVRVPEEAETLLREIRATQEREAAPYNEADDAWGSIIQRRRERITKFALLWSVSENPSDPELTSAAIC